VDGGVLGRGWEPSKVTGGERAKSCLVEGSINNSPAGTPNAAAVAMHF